MEASRRMFVLCAMAVALWPPFARAQAIRRIAILDSHPRGHEEGIAVSFIAAMAKLGYVEGKNVEYLHRNVGGDMRSRQLATLAEELVRARPDAIVTTGTALTRAIARATTTIPVVTNAGDPVGAGFAKTIARPGGNITGAALASPELYEKTFDYLKAIIPGAWSLAMAVGESASSPLMLRLRDGARKLGVPIRTVSFKGMSATQADRTLAAMRGQGIRVLVLRETVAGIPHEDPDGLLAMKYGLATIPRWEGAVPNGALMAYFNINEDHDKRRAEQMVKILRGTPPGEIPFATPTKFGLVINRKTARTLGLTIPPEILLRADEVFD